MERPTQKNTYTNDPGSAEVVQRQVETRRNIGALILEQAARQAGWDARWLTSRTVIFRKGHKQILHQGHRGYESAVGDALTEDKHLTKILLQAAGVSTPRGYLARSAQEAVKIQQQLERPIVVKPRFGMKQAGVTVNITAPSDIREAFAKASTVRHGVLVEEYNDVVQEYRCLTTPEECVSVVRQLLPNVTGDGTSSISALIEQKNEERRYIPSAHSRPIPVDSVLERCLVRQGLSLDTVLAEGQTRTVRDVGGLSTGGEAFECSDSVPETIKHVASQAARSIPGLEWGGVDVMIARETGEPYIVEINTDADLSGSAYPVYGVAADVGSRVFARRAEQAAQFYPKVDPPTLHASETTLRRDLLSLDVSPRGSKIKLATVLRLALLHRGWQVEEFAGSVFRAVDVEGKEHWFRRSLTTKDSAAVSSVMTRHATVRRALDVADVALTPSRTVRSGEELRKFMEEHSWPSTTLAASRRQWAVTHRVHSREEISGELFTSRNIWLAQGGDPERTYRVFASPHRTLAMLAPSGKSATHLNHAESAPSICETAVRAVRAIPGLRWGAVDVVFPATDSENSPLVEGISRDPVLPSAAPLVTGSLTDVIQTILDE